MTNGYIKVSRSITEWRWYKDANTFRLFMHLLLIANHADAPWQDIVIHRGEIVTSYQKLSSDLDIGVQSVRTSLNRLKLTGEVTYRSTSKYTVISIPNYDSHQTNNTTPNKPLTNNQQATNNQLTTNKNDKNNKNIKEVEIKEKNIKKENFCVPPEIAEAFAGYVEMRKKKKNPLTERAEKLLLNRLEKLAPHDYETQNKLLDEATLGGWQSVYDSKDKTSNGGDRRGYGQADKRLGFDGNSVDTMSAVVI